MHVENQLKILEKSLDEDDNISNYNGINNEFLPHYRGCEWYEHSEKSTKSFLNLEKQR